MPRTIQPLMTIESSKVNEGDVLLFICDSFNRAMSDEGLTKDQANGIHSKAYPALIRDGFYAHRAPNKDGIEVGIDISYKGASVYIDLDSPVGVSNPIRVDEYKKTLDSYFSRF